MGWGLGPEHKLKIWSAYKAITYGYNSIIDIENKETNIIIDFNAIIRNQCCRGTNPPSASVASVFKNNVTDVPGINKYTSVCFDSYNLIPDIRKEFHELERYADDPNEPGPNQVRRDGRNYTLGSEPISDEAVKNIDEYNLPYDWSRVWTNTRAKKAVMGMMENQLRMVIGGPTTRDDATYILNPDKGNVTAFTTEFKEVETEENKKKLVAEFVEKSFKTTHNYGEADQKVAEEAKYVSEKYPDRITIVRTIDGDMFISLILMRMSENVKLHLRDAKTTFDDDNNIIRAPNNCKDHVIKMPEIIHPHRINSSPYYESIGFWCIAIGGVDYCKSIAQWGYKPKSTVDIACTLSTSFVKTKILDDGRKKTVFDVQEFVNVLGECPREPPGRPDVAKNYLKHIKDPFVTVEEACEQYLSDYDDWLDEKRCSIVDTPDLTRFEKYKLSAIIKKTKKDRVAKLLEDRATRVRRYLDNLNMYNDLDAFEHELNRIFTCFLYFSQMNPCAERGGLEYVKERWFVGCKTFDDMIKKTHDNKIVYVEKEPYKKGCDFYIEQ